MGRISKFLTSEDLPGQYPVDPKSPAAVQVDGDFVWETVFGPTVTEKAGESGKGNKGPGAPGGRRGKGDGKGIKGWKSAKKGNTEGDVLPTTATGLEKDKEKIDEENVKDEGAERPFELSNLKFVIPHGAFVAIIGRVGCGKV